MTMQIDPSRLAGLRRFGNSLVEIKLRHGDSSGGVSIIEQWIPYGDSPPMHVHLNEDEVFHIIAGRMRFRVADKDLIGRAGDTILAPRGIPHSFRVEAAEGAHCLTIVHGADFETMVLRCSDPASVAALPDAVPPTPEMVAGLEKACAENGIVIVGPPLGAVDAEMAR